MTEKPNWHHQITEIIADKFHLELIDQNGYIFWCKRPFTNQERALAFAKKAQRIMRSFDWLLSYAEWDYAFYEKFFLVIDQPEFLYRHWLIGTQEIFNGWYLTLLDPLGQSIEFSGSSLEEAMTEAKARIDAIETGRFIIPGQLSLFH